MSFHNMTTMSFKGWFSVGISTSTRISISAFRRTNTIILILSSHAITIGISTRKKNNLLVLMLMAHEDIIIRMSVFVLTCLC